MSPLELEVAALETANRHISAGERRIGRQRLLIAALNADLHDTKEAEKLLALFVSTLEIWKAHRTLIQEAIRRLSDNSAV